jgi:hypothetical protein
MGCFSTAWRLWIDASASTTARWRLSGAVVVAGAKGLASTGTRGCRCCCCCAKGSLVGEEEAPLRLQEAVAVAVREARCSRGWTGVVCVVTACRTVAKTCCCRCEDRCSCCFAPVACSRLVQGVRRLVGAVDCFAPVAFDGSEEAVACSCGGCRLWLSERRVARGWTVASSGGSLRLGGLSRLTTASRRCRGSCRRLCSCCVRQLGGGLSKL